MSPRWLPAAGLAGVLAFSTGAAVILATSKNAARDRCFDDARATTTSTPMSTPIVAENC